ncbi:hypothetical protein [Chroococcidiopsis sp. CCMEE 29]|nr:hypothetical protein [Chroococcidiopsis sp. CCMEE 29]
MKLKITASITLGIIAITSTIWLTSINSSTMLAGRAPTPGRSFDGVERT